MPLGLFYQFMRLGTCCTRIGISTYGYVQSGKVAPLDLGVLLGARLEVWGEESPSHRLGDSGLEPDGHGKESFKLAEDHLLTGLYKT
jgi:hypothetical protein